MNNLCCMQSSSSGKMLDKPFKNYFFVPNLNKKRVIMGHALNGKQFFS